MEYQRAQLKQSVKQMLKGTRPRPIWITLLYLAVSTAGTAVIQRLLSGLNWSGAIVNYFLQQVSMGMDPDEAMENIAGLLLYDGAGMIGAIAGGALVISLLTYLWSSLMQVGYEGYCLEVVRGRGPGVARLFQAFPRIGGVVLTRILTGLFTFLWSLLFTVGYALVAVLAAVLAPRVPILGVLLLVAGLVAYGIGMVWVSLRYSLADYALLDGQTGLEAIRTSKALLRGSYLRLFVLQLSFIGWYLLMFAVMLVGLIVIAAALAGIGGGYLLAGASGDLGAMMAVLGIVWVVLAAAAVAVFAISLWLTPYVTGTIARFYDSLRGRALEQGPRGGAGGGQDGWGRREDAWDTTTTWTGQSGPRDPWEEGPKDPPRPPSGPSYPEY